MNNHSKFGYSKQKRQCHVIVALGKVLHITAQNQKCLSIDLPDSSSREQKILGFRLNGLVRPVYGLFGFTTIQKKNQKSDRKTFLVKKRLVFLRFLAEMIGERTGKSMLKKRICNLKVLIFYVILCGRWNVQIQSTQIAKLVFGKRIIE